MTEELSQKTARGVVALGSGTVLVTVVRLAVLVVLARLITPEEFGVAGAAMIVAGLAVALFKSGLTPALVQRPVLEPRHLHTAFVANMLAGLIAAGLLIVLAPAAAQVLNVAGVESVLPVIGLVFPLNALGVTSGALIRRNLEFAYLARIQVFSTLFGYAAVGLVGGFAGWGVWALVAANLGQTVLLVGGLLVKHPLEFPRQIQFAAFKEVYSVSAGFTLGAVGLYFSQRIDNFGVARWLGATALGVYGRAFRLMAEPADKAGEVINRVLFPSMAKIQHETKRLRAVFFRSASLTALIFLPSGLVLAILSEEIVLVFLGDQWTEAVGPFRILALALVFRAGFKVSESLIAAVGAVYRRAWRQWLSGGLVFLGVLIGHEWGLSGVAAGTGIAVAINFLLMAHLSLRLVKGTWAEFLIGHRAAASWSLLVGATAWPAAQLLRSADATPLITLIATLIVATVAVLIAMRLMPRFFASADLEALILGFRGRLGSAASKPVDNTPGSRDS